LSPGQEAPFSPAQSAAFAAGTIVLANLLQLLLVSGVEDDRGRLGGALLSFCAQPSSFPYHPEMAPCNVSVDSTMAACITYELPGTLLKLICDEGVSAILLQGVVLPTVSNLAATAESTTARVE
jgi:hypothetical protein